jgi:hypothetical protein
MRDAYDKKLEKFSNTFGLGESGSSGKKATTNSGKAPSGTKWSEVKE